MNLEEALALRERAEREIRAGVIQYGRVRDHFYGSDLDYPDDVFVVTQDGETFSLMTFAGEYSDYRFHTYESAEEWDEESADWKNSLFNPRGEWARRVVTSLDVNSRHTTLSCGHHGPPGYLDERKSCYTCQKEGVGLTPELVTEAVEILLSGGELPDTPKLQKPRSLGYRSVPEGDEISISSAPFTLYSAHTAPVSEVIITRPDGQSESVPFTQRDGRVDIEYACDKAGTYYLNWVRKAE